MIEEKKMKMRCLYCGNGLDEDEKFCGNCGRKIDTGSISGINAVGGIKDQKNGRASRKTWVIFSIVMACVIFVCACICICLHVRSVRGDVITSDTLHNTVNSAENEIRTESGESPTEYAAEDAENIGEADRSPAESLIEDDTSDDGTGGEVLTDVQIGDRISFGTYEQDGDPANGTEPIIWRVLNIEREKALVISEYALDAQPYNTEWTFVTWEDCTLRNWLNNDFLNTAFSDIEQEWIIEKRIKNPDNTDYDIKGGNDTKDKVFLLSIDEANLYFDSDSDRMCVPTAYTIAKGAAHVTWETSDGTPTSPWWLRSPGNLLMASGVLVDGSVDVAGQEVDGENGCVRPAMWIDLSLWSVS